MEGKKGVVPGEICAERAERCNHSHIRKAVLNAQKSAEAIVPWKKKTREGPNQYSRSNRGKENCIRYADDIVLLCKSQRAAERLLESSIRYLEGKLKLQVNRKKSHIAKVNTNGGEQQTRLLVHGGHRSREKRHNKRKTRTRRVL